MSDESCVRLTVDEIEPDADGELVATLVDEDGRIAVVPLRHLPEGTRVNQIIDVDFRLAPDSAERRRRIEHLQHRLFDRGHGR